MGSMKYAAVCIVAAIMIIFIREYHNSFAVLMRIAFSVSAAVVCAVMFGRIYGYMNQGGIILGLGGEGLEIFDIMLKATGIAFVGGVSSSICRDSGEGGIAGTVETICKLEIILMCIPVIDLIFDKIQAVIS